MMKPWVMSLAMLALFYASSTFAKAAVPAACAMHHEIIQSGDTAMTLTRHAGIDARAWLAWKQSAGPSALRSLRDLRPGDALDVCVTSDRKRKPAIASVVVRRNDRARRIADRLAQQSTPTPSLAHVVGDVLVTASQAAIPAMGARRTAQAMKAPSPHVTVKSLTPGVSLKAELSRVLGQRPVLRAALAFAHNAWHLSARLPTDSHCTLVFLKDHEDRLPGRLAYVQWEYHGHTRIAYHFVDTHGRTFIVGADGRGYAVLEPQLPVPDARLSSGWGWRIQPVLGGQEFHQGVDYAAPMGTPVRATLEGVVSIAQWRGDYGRVIELKHAHGLSTRYGHLSAFAPSIRPGQHIMRGQIIGYVGSTGLSTGPHLYYELWDHGVRIDPLTQGPMIFTASLDRQQRRDLNDYIDTVKVAP